MHHIKDSHEFHILDWNGKGVSIPLPIILWTDNGLVTFSSSEFHHDDEGTEVVTKKGLSFVKFHEEIYYASSESNSSGQFLSLDKNSYPTNLKPLDFSITKLVFSMFLSMILLVLIFGISAKNYSKSSKGVPSGIAKFTVLNFSSIKGKDFPKSIIYSYLCIQSSNIANSSIISSCICFIFKLIILVKIR